MQRNSCGCQIWEMRSWDGGDSGSPEQERRGEGVVLRSVPKYPESAHSRHQTRIPDLISEVPDAQMLFAFQSAPGEAGDDRREQSVSGNSSEEPGHSTRKDQLVNGCFFRQGMVI